MIIDMGQNNRCGKVVVNIPDKGRRTKRRKTFEKKMDVFYQGEGKGGKYLEKKDNFDCGGEEKGGKI